MKRILMLLTATVLSLSAALTSFAGTWQSDATGWWYQNDDGSYPAGCWQWIDGNQDGVAESYYFNENGYCLMNTLTPDGYQVDANGAWIVNGVVQTQAAAVSQAVATADTTVFVDADASAGSSDTSCNGVSHSWFEGCTIIVNTNTMKYHWPSCSSVSTIKDHNMGYANDAAVLQSWGYVPCKRCH